MGSESNEHIVMLPFMAHGHLIPFLNLAKQIQQKSPSISITIATTSQNLHYLHSSLSLSSAININLTELPFSSSIQNTENLPLHNIISLCHSSTSLELPFHKLISAIAEKHGKLPLCIISDVFLGWSVKVAKTFKTPIFIFTTCGAYGTLAYISLWLNLPHRSSDSDEFSLPGFPERCRFHKSHLHKFLRAADGTDPWSKFFQPQISCSMDSDGWLCNTVEEVESFGLKLLRDYLKLPVFSIGPVLPQLISQEKASTERSGKVSEAELEKCMNWLNFQTSDSSVLYVSFGSQNTISKTQMMELAIGLEESGKSFIWVVRPPLGFDIKGEFEARQWLPERFEERMKETKRGILIRNWAPQLEILSHRSVGAFLSHCGWNSTLESLSYGVAVISWPMAAEQAYNSKMLVEEMGVGVELARGLESDIKREKVKEVIEIVMGKSGEEMREKAAIVKEKIRAAVKEEGEDKGSSVRALDEFLAMIRSKRRELQK